MCLPDLAFAGYANLACRMWFFAAASVDNTLSLLYRSAVSRGLPHRITQNLSHMSLIDAKIRNPIQPTKRPWRGQLPQNAPEYERQPIKPLTPAQVEHDSHYHLARRFLGELVGMAEGWSGISLGRTQQRR